MSSSGRLLFAATLALVTYSADAADSLTTTSGKKLTGKLVSVDGQGVTFDNGQGAVKVPGKDILLIDLGHPITEPAKGAKYNELELTDGSTFRIGKFAIKGKKVSAELLPGPKGELLPALDVGLSEVFAIMRNADDPKARDAWKKVLAGRGKRDLYVIRESEGLNFVPGTILGGTDAGDALIFEKEDGSQTELRLSRATGGLVFSQTQPTQVAAKICKVYDVFGNALIARAVVLEASGATLTTVNGVTLKYGSAASLAKLDYGQGNIAYLSDLEPQVEGPPPPADEKGLRLNITAPYTRDHSVGNEPLRLGGETFAKGLTVAPDTKLLFTIGGDFRELRALIGLQEFTSDAGLEAKLTIETDDGRVLFSEMLKRKDKPRPIALDVKGVKQVRLVVDADLGINGNRVVLADAKVQK